MPIHSARDVASDDLAPDPPPDTHHRWRAFLRHWGVVVLLSAGALSVFADLGEDVFNHETGTFDAAVRAWTLAHRTPGLLTAFAWITRLGSPLALFALVILTAIWLWREHARRVAAVVLAAPTIAVAFFLVVKQLIHRARPAGGLLLHDVTFSFPSGHATASAAVFGTLAWVLAREGKVPWIVAVPLAIICPLLIGTSRIYLDVHWATDVLAGWCAGAAVAVLSAGVYERGRRQRANT